MMNSLSLNSIDNLFTLFNLKEDSKDCQSQKLTNLPKNNLSHNPNEIESKINNNNSGLKNKTILQQLTVGVFFHHRDVQVVLEELTHAGFPLNSLTLMARNCQRHNWLFDLNIFSHFEKEIFNFSQECEQFFQKFFRRGKYILVVEGTEDMLHFAGKVLSRRLEHSKVWYLVKHN